MPALGNTRKTSGHGTRQNPRNTASPACLALYTTHTPARADSGDPDSGGVVTYLSEGKALEG